MKLSRLLLLTALAVITSELFSQQTIDISDYGWNIRLENKVDWTQEKIDLKVGEQEDLEINPPREGWISFQSDLSEDILLPSAIEDHIWNKNEQAFEQKGEFQGVAWYYTFFDIPSYWKKKRIFLQFESVEMKAEIYINEKLAGYDIVNGTPFELDITDYIARGKLNLLALRITDPYGNEELNQQLPATWQKYASHSTNGNGGISGKVLLSARDDIYISDLIIKNMQNASSIQATAEVNNSNSRMVSGNLIFSLLDAKSGKVIVEKERYLDKIFGSWVISMSFTQKDFEENQDYNQITWTPQNPHTYKIRVRWDGKDRSSSIMEKDAAFRSINLNWTPDEGQVFINENLFEDSLSKIEIRTLPQKSEYTGIGPGKEDLFIQELAAWESDDSEQDRWQRIEKSVRRVKAARNNPLLLMYRAHHEIEAGELELLRTHLRELHSLDPTRMMLFSYTINSTNLDSEIEKTNFKYMYILPFTNEILTEKDIRD